MKILLIADMEGVTGVVHPDQLLMERNPTEYGRARKLFTEDVNAAVEGAVKAGADEVVVFEGHANMRNLLIEDLHANATLVCGPVTNKPHCQFHVTNREFAAAVFIGFHAMAGNEKGLLAHTWAGAVVHHICVNGKPFGETALDAALCGHFNIPLVAVSGDQYVCSEAKETVGEWVHGIQVKETLGPKLAMCYSPKKTLPMITQEVQAAIENRSAAKVFTVKSPVTIELGFHHVSMATKAMRAKVGERTGDREITISSPDILTGIEQTWACILQTCLEESSWLG